MFAECNGANTHIHRIQYGCLRFNPGGGTFILNFIPQRSVDQGLLLIMREFFEDDPFILFQRNKTKDQNLKL